MALRDLGVEECSLHDGAVFTGSASIHDQYVLDRAESELEKGVSSLMWLNLLACRDVLSELEENSVDEALSRDAQLMLPKSLRSSPLRQEFKRVSPSAYVKAMGRSRTEILSLHTHRSFTEVLKGGTPLW